jgi:hypothetical protein
MMKSKRQKELDFGIRQYRKLLGLSPVQFDLFQGFVRRMFFLGKEDGLAVSAILQNYIQAQAAREQQTSRELEKTKHANTNETDSLPGSVPKLRRRKSR